MTCTVLEFLSRYQRAILSRLGRLKTRELRVDELLSVEFSGIHGLNSLRKALEGVSGTICRSGELLVYQ
jgi:hypothetical protein